MIIDDGFKCCDDCFNCDLFLSMHDCAYERFPIDGEFNRIWLLTDKDYELQNTCD